MQRLRWRQIRWQRLSAQNLLTAPSYSRFSPRWRQLSTTAPQGIAKATKSKAFFDFDLPAPHNINGDALESVLRQARQYGIETQQQLAFETDLGHRRYQGTRLTDHIANRQDLDLWAILLDYKNLVDGDEGIQHLVHGMRFRGDAVRLYSEDVASDYIWNLLVDTAMRNEDVLFGICNPKTGVGRSRATLFIDVVGRLLQEGKVQKAKEIGTLLRKSHFRGCDDLLFLFKTVCSSESASIKDFCSIHERLPFNPIYAQTVPKLWEGNRAQDAWILHKYLLERDDRPTNFEHIEGLIRNLAQKNGSLDVFLHELIQSGISFSAQARRTYAQEKVRMASRTITTTDVIDGKALGVRPHKLSDEFVARAFATSSVSFEFVVNSLRFFGFVEVGPLTLREVALSAGNLDALRRRFERLEELEIDLGSSVFVTVIKNLCVSGSEDLLWAVLHSDQHHDVFEDRETQKKLLADYYHRRKWPEVNRTLAILNFGRINSEAQRRSSRLLIQSAIVTRDWRGALEIIARLHRVPHNGRSSLHRNSINMSLRAIIDMVLPVYGGTSSKTDEHLSRYIYLAGILQDLVTSGFFVSARHWRRLLFAIGGLGGCAKMEKLSMWLASFYGKTHNSRQGQTRDYNLSIDELFDPTLQAAMVEWGFCSMSKYGAATRQTSPKSRRGVILLQRLHDEFGVTLDREVVRDIFVRRLRRILRHQGLIQRYIAFFDNVWRSSATDSIDQPDYHMDTLSREELEELYQRSIASSSMEEWEDDDPIQIDDSGTDQVVESTYPISNQTQWRSQDGIDVYDQDGVVEYQDLFHPSSREYNR